MSLNNNYNNNFAKESPTQNINEKHLILNLKVAGLNFEAEKVDSAEGPNAINISSFYRETANFVYDPGFTSTASCKSSITFIDGEKSILRYRGYSIEDIAATKSFIDTAYLLAHDDFPKRNERKEFVEILKSFSLLPDSTKKVIEAFSPRAHPMIILSAAFSSLASYYNKNSSESYNKIAIATVPLIIAYIYKYINQNQSHNLRAEPLKVETNINRAPDIEFKWHENLTYCENFLYIFSGVKNQKHAEILDKILILHADHEQNASTSTVRMVVSTGADPLFALSSGCAALSGPLHGGANEKVINMLDQILQGQNSGDTVENYIEKAKNKDSGFRLMGFGHRIYKSYDPRAQVLHKFAPEILKDNSENAELFKIAQKLEETALSDPYFISRNLYPNVDFYSGLILKAIGIPTNMFTLIFALARTAGWVAHIEEMKNDKEQKLYRPRQVYIGQKLRNINNY